MKRFAKYIYLTVCVVLMLSTYANAYIDPSVMTYTIQAIAGVAIAAGAVIGIAWRRAKKKVQKKLGIDENSKKEVEDEVQEISEDGEAQKADKTEEIVPEE